jgi:two-component system, OmpR family, sensor histidine kinase KdpD
MLTDSLGTNAALGASFDGNASDPGGKAIATPSRSVQPTRSDPIPHAVAPLAIIVSLGISKLILSFPGTETVDLVFITTMVTVTVWFGLGPSLLAAIAASLCNIFLLPPVYTFPVAEPTNVVPLIVFTIVGVLVSNSAAGVLAGLGIGLAISRGFVEAMGGRITAGDRTDRTGAVFTITLPVPVESKSMEEAA